MVRSSPLRCSSSSTCCCCCCCCTAALVARCAAICCAAIRCAATPCECGVWLDSTSRLSLHLGKETTPSLPLAEKPIVRRPQPDSEPTEREHACAHTRGGERRELGPERLCHVTL